MEVSLSDRIGFTQLPGKYGYLTASNRGPIDICIDELDTLGKNALINKIRTKILIVKDNEKTRRELKELDDFYQSMRPEIRFKPADIKPLNNKPLGKYNEDAEELQKRINHLLRSPINVLVAQARELKPYEVEAMILAEEKNKKRKALLKELTKLLDEMKSAIPVKQQLSEADKKELQKSIDFMSRREVGSVYSKLISPVVEEEEEEVIIKYSNSETGD